MEKQNTRFILYIEKQFNYDRINLDDIDDSKYPQYLTGDEFIGLKTDLTNIQKVIELVKTKFIEKAKSSLNGDEIYFIRLGDTQTGYEIMFNVDVYGKLYVMTEDIEPISGMFTEYMMEYHKDVMDHINEEWDKKLNQNARRMQKERRLEEEREKAERERKRLEKQQKIRKGIVDEDDEDTWPYWIVKWKGESGNTYIDEVRAIDYMHASDIAHDLFWDIADVDDDKLTDIISIKKKNLIL